MSQIIEQRRPLVAVTGSTGFVGQRLVQTLIKNGYRVSALTRREQDERDHIHWIKGDLADRPALRSLCAGAEAVIHVAGLTNAVSREDYFRVNEKGALAVFDAAAEERTPRVIHLSSMAAREPHLAAYAESKAAADRLLSSRLWPFKWISVRPPAIYGPGDKELLKAIKLARGAFGPALYPSPSGLNSRAGFIHVDDLCDALTVLVADKRTNLIGELDDGKNGGYSPQDIVKAMTQGTKTETKIFSLPKIARFIIGQIADLNAQVLEIPSKLMSDQLDYLAHADWSVTPEHQLIITGWSPKTSLQDGMRQTIEWYIENGLLRP